MTGSWTLCYDLYLCKDASHNFISSLNGAFYVEEGGGRKGSGIMVLFML